MTKVIIFNGPPDCGKDSITKYLSKKHPDVFYDMKLSKPLKEGCHTLLGMSDVRHDRFEDVKDEPRVEFFGSTPREFYIRVAENLIKAMYGQETFGHIWLRLYGEYFKDTGAKLVTISDCGFLEELGPLFKEFTAKEMILIRIHREGYGFERDSRSYIRTANPEFREYDVENPNGHMQDFFNRIDFILNSEGIFSEAYAT